MKKCPNCKAEIEDNANFCLYCMTSLADKENIEIKNKKSPALPFVICAVLFVLLAVSVAAFTLKAFGDGEHPFGNASGDIAASKETGTTLKADSQSTEGTTSAHKTQSGDNTADVGSVADEENKTLPQETTSHRSTVPPETQSESKAPQSDKDDVENGEASSNSFTYRKAEPTDDFAVNYPIPENAVVITGVSSVSSDGIYRIPETIDGNQVFAVMGLAFCDEDVAPTVRKVVIPSTVKTVWNYAFYNCTNLTDIYLCPDAVYIESQAFAPKSRRNSPLTIHASYGCSDRNLRYYRNSASYYDANFKEWDGTVLN